MVVKIQASLVTKEIRKASADPHRRILAAVHRQEACEYDSDEDETYFCER